MRWPHMPEPMGVLRCVEKPTYDEAVDQQLAAVLAKSGPGNLEDLFHSGDTWQVT
jgi:2-oxoglutarate ferredoxin oxidoreductase subunit beta